MSTFKQRFLNKAHIDNSSYVDIPPVSDRESLLQPALRNRLTRPACKDLQIMIGCCLSPSANNPLETIQHEALILHSLCERCVQP